MRDRERIVAELDAKAGHLQDETLLQSRWREECRRRRDDYLCDLLGYNHTMRKLRRLLGATVHSKEAVRVALHLAQCESHSEVLQTLFRDERLGK